MGSSTTATIPGLIAGATYYFVATAYDVSGHESAFSAPLKVVVPKNPATTAAQPKPQPAPSPVSGSVAVRLPAGKLTGLTERVPRAASPVTRTASPPAVKTTAAVTEAPVATEEIGAAAAAAAAIKLQIIPGTDFQSPILLEFPVSSGHWYEIQATTDFQTWAPIWQTGVAEASGWMQFADPEAGAFVTRFYRLEVH